MSDTVLVASCDEPGGTVKRTVRVAPFTMENLRHWWEELSKFPVLFNRHIQGLDDFIATFLTQDSAGNLKANGIVWEVDDVGIIFMTDIFPLYQATGHFSFWDQRFRGRENLLRQMLRYVFTEYGFRRVIAEVPLYSHPTLKAVERIGFVKEGRLRKAAWYQGEWWDVNLYSVLEDEIDGLLEATKRNVPAAVTSIASSG